MREGEGRKKKKVVKDIGKMKDERKEDDRKGRWKENEKENMEEDWEVYMWREKKIGRERIVIIEEIKSSEKEEIEKMKEDKKKDGEWNKKN